MGKAFGIVALLVVIALGGYYFSTQSEQSLQKGADSAIEKAKEAKQAVEESQTVSSIQDAMGLGKKMTCTYSTEQGGQMYSSTVVLEGKRFQSTSVMGDTTMYALNDGTTQYTWTSKDKQGFKMDLSCLEEMKALMKDLPQMKGSAPDVTESFDMAKDTSCEAGGNVELTVPEDITFTDQCAPLKQSMEMMKKLPQSMPQSVPSSMPSTAPAY